MSEDTTITSTLLSRSTSEILNRVVYRGEHFTIQRGGKTVARIVPVPIMPVTLKQLARELEGVILPGDGFADDLEEVQKVQPIEQGDKWSNS